MNEHDIRFLQHALALGRNGTGLASPNPMVGCVIVRDGEIVGEGFHQYDWRDHAEIVALKSAGEKARGATLYVNLEPCNHTGRTGPCTEAIIAAGVRRVVAAIGSCLAVLEVHDAAHDPIEKFAIPCPRERSSIGKASASITIELVIEAPIAA